MAISVSDVRESLYLYSGVIKQNSSYPTLEESSKFNIYKIMVFSDNGLALSPFMLKNNEEITNSEIEGGLMSAVSTYTRGMMNSNLDRIVAGEYELSILSFPDSQIKVLLIYDYMSENNTPINTLINELYEPVGNTVTKSPVVISLVNNGCVPEELEMELKLNLKTILRQKVEYINDILKLADDDSELSLKINMLKQKINASLNSPFSDLEISQSMLRELNELKKLNNYFPHKNIQKYLSSVDSRIINISENAIARHLETNESSKIEKLKSKINQLNCYLQTIENITNPHEDNVPVQESNDDDLLNEFFSDFEEDVINSLNLNGELYNSLVSELSSNSIITEEQARRYMNVENDNELQRKINYISMKNLIENSKQKLKSGVMKKQSISEHQNAQIDNIQELLTKYRN